MRNTRVEGWLATSMHRGLTVKPIGHPDARLSLD